MQVRKESEIEIEENRKAVKRHNKKVTIVRVLIWTALALSTLFFLYWLKVL